MGVAWSPERRAKFEASRASKAETAVLEQPLLGESEYEDDEPEILRPDGSSQSAPDGASFLSRSELFKQRMRTAAPIVTTGDVDELGAEERQVLDGGAVVQHTSAGLVVMFKHEIWGWRRLAVSRNSVPELIDAGFLPYCGNCRKTNCAGEINQCPATPKVMFRDCPVAGCNQGNGHRVYDDGQATAVDPSSDAFDEKRIIDTTYSSTPETRTKAMLDEHIRWYHPQTAAYMGIAATAQQMAV